MNKMKIIIAILLITTIFASTFSIKIKRRYDRTLFAKKSLSKMNIGPVPVPVYDQYNRYNPEFDCQINSGGVWDGRDQSCTISERDDNFNVPAY